MSAPIRIGGKPTAFGAKLRIYAAHNPSILQMVANLSMPTYYRFHFPTWMETHKGLKNCFCPLFLRVTQRGWGRERARRWSFNLFHPVRVRSRRKVQRKFIHDFFPSIPAFSEERNAKIERYEWNQTAFDIEGKVTVIDQMKKWTIERDFLPQKNTFQMIH